MPATSGREVPDSMRGLGKISSEINHRAGFEVPVLVLADNTNLRVFSAQVYAQLETLVASRGGSFAISEEELLRYFITAMKARVDHTTPQFARVGPKYGMTVHDRWAIPYNMAYVINALGVVTYGAAQRRIYPVWSPSANTLLLKVQEAQRITAYLAALKPLGVRLAPALESNREGVVKVMVLTWMNDNPEGEWLSPEPFSVVDAVTASIAGLRPSADYTRPENPLWIPEHRMDHITVVRYVQEGAMITLEG